MVNIYLFNYNNYYNRIYKKEDTLLGYGTPVLSQLSVHDFNMSDGVNTQAVFNIPTPYADISPDYCIITDTTENIISRWFVIEAEYNRKGQYICTLHRDLIADNYDAVITAPMYIEKATVQSPLDPAIYQSEGILFNQIKRSEWLIKDATRSAWVVGYVDHDSTAHNGITYTPPGTLARYPTDPIFAQFYGKSGTLYSEAKNITTKATFDVPNAPLNPNSYYVYLQQDQDATLNIEEGRFPPCKYQTDWDWGTGAPRAVRNAYTAKKASSDAYWSTFKTILESGKDTYDAEDIAAITKYNGQVVQYSSNLYTIKVETLGTITTGVDLTSAQAESAYAPAVATGYTRSFTRGDQDKTCSASCNFDTFKVSFEAYSGEAIVVDINGSRPLLKNAAYDMFCIPYNSIRLFEQDEAVLTTKENIAAPIGSAIAQDLTQSKCYDLQLLPFCPIPEFINDKGGINIDNMVEHNDFDYITQNSNNVSAIFWCRSDNFKQAGLFTYIPTDYVPTNTIEYKIANETKFCRVCSPNYAGAFEFKPTEALTKAGYVQTILSYTYRPYNPYIQVSFEFDKLYGGDFGDSRGLICGGDYSLPQMTDQWKLYQVNNKYATEIFDRQIENMEVNQAIQKKQEIWQAAAGTLQGAAAGAAAGRFVGGGMVGAGIGAAVGGAASLAGGIADVYYNDKLRAEAIDYTKDQFNYSLQTIQALPNTIAKCGAQQVNNKIFPFLELYSATPEEEQALRDKIKYNGMSINRIGTIGQFIQETPTYIKGQLIRLENVEADFHDIKSISDELYKGVFI